MLASAIFDGNTLLLQRQVLVLNRLWQAVNVISARRAFVLLFQGDAQVVHQPVPDQYETYDFDSWRDVSRHLPEIERVRTISYALGVPQVIVLSVYDRLPRKEVRFTRHNIFERDRNTCQYCGKVFDRRDLNLDHVLPRDRGGGTSWENIVCSCISCNSRKANRLPHEAGMRLMRLPSRPRWQPFQEIRGRAEASWQRFLDVAYWNVELGCE